MPSVDDRVPSTSAPAVAAPAGGRVSLVSPVPLWRREPYRLLFPEALLLAWAGVLVWPLYASGVVPGYPSDHHAVAQIEGFVACIAAGFLFTFIPRRTGTRPAGPVAVALAMVAPIVTVTASALDVEVVSQASWLVFVAVLVAFAVPRLVAKGAALKLPNAIVWVPAGLVLGAGGAILRVWGGLEEDVPLRIAGQGQLVQGMLTAFVIGIGATLLPVLTRGASHGETAGTPRDLAAKVLHVGGAALLAASFFVEAWGSIRLAFALRAAVVLVALLVSARIGRPPTVPGLHRRLIWISAWLLPAGYALVAAFPAYEEAALHVVYIGAFALMALSVAYHVAVAHGGDPAALAGRPAPVVAMALLFLGALAARGLVDVDRGHEGVWLAVAAVAFLAGTICWAALVLPRLRRFANGDAERPS